MFWYLGYVNAHRCVEWKYNVELATNIQYQGNNKRDVLDSAFEMFYIAVLVDIHSLECF